MATIEQIQEFLGFEIPEGKTLREGKHKPKKNQYYYYQDHYYIVKLTKGKWMVLDDSPKTRRLLRKHTWYWGTRYASTTVDHKTKTLHQLLIQYDKGLVADHINR